MSMDAAWKVYVGDRRFDDNQISNCFIKLKYETVGRFTFDFRPIDGDESYMVVNNTLRIFWGDLHKLDGVIQRVDWDETQYCYHVFGADIRGFLLDRVNTEPSTVSSYTSDITTTLMYEGCDFPSNVWTGAGDKIGTYTFHYKLGIQNTIRITSATQNIWHNVIERGTVYEHQNGCLYDATKSWATNQYAGATLRFVSGACKNNIYNVNGNTANRVCIRLPGEPASMYGGGYDPTIVYEGETLGQIIRDPGIEEGSGGSTYPGDLDAWVFLSYTKFPDEYAATETDDSYRGSIAYSVYIADPNDGYNGAGGPYRRWETPGGSAYGGWVVVKFFARVDGTWEPGNSIGTTIYLTCDEKKTGLPGVSKSWQLNTYGASTTWTEYTLAKYVSPANNTYGRDSKWDLKFVVFTTPGNITSETITVYFDDVRIYAQYHDPVAFGGGAAGTVPGCSRLGDIYEIVTASMERIEPASLAPATLEKDNHIIRYNNSDDLSDHTTVVTVMGAD